MKKGAKRKGPSKAARKGPAADESQNDEVVAESLEASTQEESQQPNAEAEAKPEITDSSNQVDEVKDASPSQQQEDVKAEEVDEDKKKPGRPRGGKRKRATKKEVDVKDEKKPPPRAKKARVAKPQEEPEYFEDERNLVTRLIA